MRKKRTNTVRTRVFVALICIVIMQCLVFTGVILLTGTLDELDESANTIFENTVSKNAETLESQIIECTNLDEYEQEITQLIWQLSEQNNQAVSEYVQSADARTEVLDNSSELVLQYLRELDATGCFIILDDGVEGTSKDAIVLRDLDPKNDSLKNGDILIEAGSNKWLLEQGCTMDSYWTKKLPITEDSAFYYEPLNAGNQYSDIESKDLGYYSKSFRFHENDLEVITYTRPLLDENHHAYGVIGVELSLNYIQSIFSNMSIGITQGGHYYIGITENGTDYETVVVQSGIYQSKVESLGIIKMHKDKRFFRVENDGATNLIMSLHSCQLYNTNTPFESEQWVIGGFVGEEIITRYSHRLLVKLIIAVVVSVIICLIGAIALSSTISRPIKILLAGVENNLDGVLKLPRTRIKEIDNLADEIERKTAEVYNSGSKLANIIQIANVNLGVLEYVEDSDEIFCTEQLVKMLDLSLVNWHNNYVPRAKNEAILQEKIESLFKEEEEEDIYRYEKSDGEVTWIRIQSVKNENSELSVFMDVTASMEDKMKIAHDRDHDGLTNLYNRWAFNRKVEKLLISGKCTTGVLTIWDLDHLKHVNDTYGHERGDQYICSLARALDSEQFAYYIPARMAGDEFMTFIYNDTIENMYMRMTQIHQRFSQQTLELPDGQILEMSVSAGMAVYPNDAVVYQDLMENADFAMYEVKKSGRGNIKAFTGRNEKEGNVSDSQS